MTKGICRSSWIETTRFFFRAIAVCSVAFSLLLITGCGGCGGNNSAKKTAEEKKKEEEEKKKKKPKPPFENKPPVVLPGQESNAVAANRGKGGHWVNAHIPAVSNRNDFDGVMNTRCVRGNGRPQIIRGTHYFMQSTRPVSMPKEQWKNFETTLFIPTTGNRKGGGGNTTFDFRISPRSGAGGFSQPQGILLLKEYQFHFVVLAEKPGAYTYLKNADFIKLPEDEFRTQRLEDYYHLVFSNTETTIPLPSHSLAWTTVAYILWHDVEPDNLTPEQKSALIDWLHWGGQLILSGPDCLDKLKNSFLADYLPANVRKSVNLNASDIQELNQGWSIPVRNKNRERHSLSLPGQSTMVGCQMDLTEGSQFIPNTSELVAEKRIGRGRIVATGFSLQAKPLLTWKSLQGFYQTVLMRRPARRFSDTGLMGEVFFRWKDGGALLDPLLGSTVRYVSRDLGVNGTDGFYNYEGKDPADEVSRPNRFNFGQPESSTSIAVSENTRVTKDAWRFGGFNHSPESGVAGWNDYSGVATAARETLRTAAGITPPSRGFVLQALLIYLSILVPANWLLFKLIGRVEWAWVMAPIISIVGAVGVAKFASLDIGFVRSSTTVGVLELQGGYSRGHLTNYTALYTSLSTDYDIEFSDDSALVLPFSKSEDYRLAADASPNGVQFQIGRNVSFNGFPIQSNTSELYHSEDMIDVGGGIHLMKQADGRFVVSNTSQLDLKDTAVVWKTRAGAYNVAWVGDLISGQDTDVLEFRDTQKKDLYTKWEKSPTMYSPARHARQIVEALDVRPDEIPMVSVMNILEEDPRTKGQFDIYKEATLSVRSIPTEQRQAFPDLYVNEDQLRDICDLANDEVRFRLGGILDLFLNQLDLENGEFRLLGWTEQKVSRATIRPSATQSKSKTMVLVHLQRPQLERPPREPSIYSDYTKLSDDEDEDEDEEDKKNENGDPANPSGIQ